MISAQDKQAILDGAYGVTRAGKKVKYVGKRDTVDKDPAFPHFFVVFNQNDEISRTLILSEYLTASEMSGIDNDVVGLWADKPEPFNLERALAGEPVKLRDGLKAYVKYIMPSEHGELYPVHGYFFDPDEPTNVEIEQWTEEGKAYIPDPNSDSDIISMWEDPEPKTVTLTLPCPLKEPTDELWFICGGSVRKSDHTKHSVPINEFNKAVFFGSEAEAQKWLDAMRNNRK